MVEDRNFVVVGIGVDHIAVEVEEHSTRFGEEGERIAVVGVNKTYLQ